LFAKDLIQSARTRLGIPNKVAHAESHTIYVMPSDDAVAEKDDSAVQEGHVDPHADSEAPIITNADVIFSTLEKRQFTWRVAGVGTVIKGKLKYKTYKLIKKLDKKTREAIQTDSIDPFEEHEANLQTSSDQIEHLSDAAGHFFHIDPALLADIGGEVAKELLLFLAECGLSVPILKHIKSAVMAGVSGGLAGRDIYRYRGVKQAWQIPQVSASADAYVAAMAMGELLDRSITQKFFKMGTYLVDGILGGLDPTIASGVAMSAARLGMKIHLLHQAWVVTVKKVNPALMDRSLFSIALISEDCPVLGCYMVADVTGQRMMNVLVIRAQSLKQQKNPDKAAIATTNQHIKRWKSTMELGAKMAGSTPYILLNKDNKIPEFFTKFKIAKQLITG